MKQFSTLCGQAFSGISPASLRYAKERQMAVFLSLPKYVFVGTKCRNGQRKAC
ncbi:MAG: hypothetical protein PHI52_09195 [Bacteroidales bacterium]|nr:hypothetical protein [Bacteroidales bacterium]MDD4210497.1 hypothetical protein [Bacteroidales bacterium]